MKTQREDPQYLRFFIAFARYPHSPSRSLRLRAFALDFIQLNIFSA